MSLPTTVVGDGESGVSGQVSTSSSDHGSKLRYIFGMSSGPLKGADMGSRKDFEVP